MKHFLLTLLLFTSLGLSAQIPSGNELSGNIVGTDIKGDSINVFKWLAEGKTVVIDVFATWCGPCWSFHQSGMLKGLHEQYGPDGTDELRIIAIEGDGNTAESELYNSALGNWTTGVKYQIMNNHTFNSILQINYFPTLYVIRPNKRVFEVGGYRGSRDIWERAMFPKAPIDIIPVSGMESRTFCNNAAFNQKPTILNLGSDNIANMKVDFIRNGEVREIEVTNEIPVFKETSIPLPTINQFSETTLFEAIIKEVNGVVIAENERPTFSSTYLRPIVDELEYQIRFTTDFYPGEISWEIKDNKQRSIFKKKYNPGSGQWGSGGADAHKTFVHDITLPDADITCLTLSITDSGQDGLTSFNPATNPIPGVEIIKKDGTIIKPKMVSDYDFSTSRTVLARFLLSSDVNDVLASKFSVYPNPTMDILNISNTLESGMTYRVFVSDMLGRQVTPASENSSFVDVQSLIPGMYVLNIMTNEGKATFKFTKQ